MSEFSNMNDDPTRTQVEIVGPFKERHLVINGWRVPLMSACELDGGKVSIVLDHSIGMECDVKDFPQIASFLADTIGRCLGYGAHPQADAWYVEGGLENPFDNPHEQFAHVLHPSLRPKRVHEITSVKREGVDDA